MTVKSTPAALVNLHVGAPSVALSGSMQIQMKTRKVYTDNTVLNTGSIVSVTQDWGQLAVESGWATDLTNRIPQIGQQTLPDAEEMRNLTALPNVWSPFTGIIPNAAQGHWSEPNALVTTDGTYVGFAAPNGGYGIALISPDMSRWTYSIIDQAEPDDHNVPCIQTIATGRQAMTMYASHSLRDFANTQRATQNGSAVFQDRQTVLTDEPVTYSQMWRITSGSKAGRLYRFYRKGTSSGADWATQWSDDEGETWGTEVVFLNTEYMLAARAPDGTGIRFYAVQHPVSGSDHDLYYAVISATNDNVIIPGGTIIFNLASPGTAIDPATQMAKVVDIVNPNTLRLFNIAGQNAGASTAALACEFDTAGGATNGNYYRYVVAGTGSPFTRELVCASGGPFYQSTSWYYGGACFDNWSIDTIYACRKVANVWRLSKFERVGASNYTETVLMQSGNILARPKALSNGWIVVTEFSRYTTFEDFEGQLRVITGARSV